VARQVASPEQELCFAVVKLAIEDLTSSDEQACFEAHEFMFQKHGGWADMRRMYFDQLGLDEESVQAKLAHLCDPPERPEKAWTMLEVYEVLPETPFKAADIGNVVGLRYSQMTARFQHLMRMGLLTRLDRGLFIRTDCHQAWVDSVVAEVPDDPEPGPTQRSQASLLDVLKEGPKTIREIGFAFDGELSVDAIRQRLDRAKYRGLVEKEGPKWRAAA